MGLSPYQGSGCRALWLIRENKSGIKHNQHTARAIGEKNPISNSPIFFCKTAYARPVPARSHKSKATQDRCSRLPTINCARARLIPRAAPARQIASLFMMERKLQAKVAKKLVIRASRCSNSRNMRITLVRWQSKPICPRYVFACLLQEKSARICTIISKWARVPRQLDF